MSSCSPLLLLAAVLVLSTASSPAIRHRRDSDLKSETQAILDGLFHDQEKMEEKIKSSMREDEAAMKHITQNLMRIANEMAEIGSEDIRSAVQWTHAQRELRRGIRLIIASYHTYMHVHRRLCSEIEKFTRDMMRKYESELSALDQMTAPQSTRAEEIDFNSPNWTIYRTNYDQMQNYAHVHRQTLPFAFDCINDLIKRVVNYRSVIFYPPESSSQRISFPTSPSNLLVGSSASEMTINCNDVSQYNGNQICANTVAQMSQQQAQMACACPMPTE